MANPVTSNGTSSRGLFGLPNASRGGGSVDHERIDGHLVREHILGYERCSMGLE